MNNDVDERKTTISGAPLDILLDMLLIVYGNQTTDEKGLKRTRELNGTGFNSPDARILSMIAEQYINTGTVSNLHVWILREKLPRYHKQISCILGVYKV